MTIMNNALSGALASQLALSATSQNIANLQTKGYTRQAAMLSAVGADASGKAVGNGVQVSSLIRFSDGYKSQQMWRANAETGQFSQTQPYLTQLERVMGDDSASLSVAVDGFFASLNAVAGDNATSTPLRQQVLTSSSLLAQRFNSLNNVFNAQLQSVSQQRSAIVDSANANIDKIAALNTRISQANAVGAPTSSLIDARDLAIDELAGQVALEVSEQPGGVRDISLKTGQALVIGSVAGKLHATGGIVDQGFTLEFASTTFALDATRLGGQLGGLTVYEKDTLRPMQQGVADVARQLAEKVNTQMAAGFAMDGTPGKPLFVFTPGTTNMLQVTAGLEPTGLAFSSDGTEGDTGNLQKLVQINSQTINVTGLGTVLLSDADTQLVGKLGVLSQQNQADLVTAQTMRTHAVDDWQTTSGVNQDEEAVNLVEYQNMYQANMKVMSVANALFDATLAMMG
ncbi:flagellar hook-associated protein FlgK [Massilia sp. Dwa41.01b]|uniref:flagellar hook-associated protein FlgK n=1 Tax=Massilia sp. Dwa41.01b TaxID=2709302 RepID=UPI0016026DB6|nr:flagellar hook-associated protein FlgK [Massilia sp. Dwa41.01b]QNA88195.1 flagellar hook-associated protein FlgK [Massilia sp. Dwa41.01b]